jgi:Shikimate kinase
MKTNLVLIGMPGSGKSTVGKQVARSLGYTFFDTDAMVEQAAGMTIPAIFEEHGECYFRDLESEAARKISLAQRAVVSCGGGMILREENMVHLGRSGQIFFLDRPLEQLKTAYMAGRPLVQEGEEKDERLERLYTQRYDIYKKYAKYLIDNDGSVDQVAKILVELYRKERDNESVDTQWV